MCLKKNLTPFTSLSQWDGVFVWAGVSFHNFPVQQLTKATYCFESEEQQYWQPVIILSEWLPP